MLIILDNMISIKKVNKLAVPILDPVSNRDRDYNSNRLDISKLVLKQHRILFAPGRLANYECVSSC